MSDSLVARFAGSQTQHTASSAEPLPADTSLSAEPLPAGSPSAKTLSIGTAASIVGFVLVTGGLAVSIAARPREDERMLYANLPIRTIGRAIRRSWLPEPFASTVSGLQLRLAQLIQAADHLWFGRLMSVVLGIVSVRIVLDIAKHWPLRVSTIQLLGLVSNGVLVAQSSLFDSSVQQTVAAGLLVSCALGRVRRPTLVRLLLMWIAGGFACAVSPRMVVLVGLVGAGSVLAAWGRGRRWEFVAVTPGVVGAAGVAVLNAYWSAKSPDFTTDAPWALPMLGNLVIVVSSVLLVALMAFDARRFRRQLVGVGNVASSGQLIVGAWAISGSLVCVWSLLKNGPVVWWSVPSVWLLWAAGSSTAKTDSTTSTSPRGSRDAEAHSRGRLASALKGLLPLQVIGAVGLLVISAVGWIGLTRGGEDTAALASTVFAQSRTGDQIVFLPSHLRVGFERYRPPTKFVPEPEYPSGPWGGYPSGDSVPSTLAPQVGERIADIARRVWVVTSTKREFRDQVDEALSSMRLSADSVLSIDLRRGGLRVRCFVLTS